MSFTSNYIEFKQPDLLVFNHLPKCGGNSMHKILNNSFRTEETYTVKVRSDGSLTTDQFHEKFETSNIRLLKGHLGLFSPDEVVGDTLRTGYFTFLRNPINRTVSYYQYCKQTPRNKFYEAINKNDLGIIDFLEQYGDKHRDIFNGQSKLIACQDNTTNLLENALSKIDERYFFIGFTEYYEESLALLNEVMDLDLSTYNKVNTTDKSSIVLRDEEIEYITEQNAIDLKLYNTLLEEFNELRRAKDAQIMLTVSHLNSILAKKQRRDKINLIKHKIKSLLGMTNN